MKFISGIAIYFVLVAWLSGCGGGGDSASGSPSKITLSGVVQKGPFSALKLSAFPVNETTAVIGQAIDAQVSGQSYSVGVPADTPMLLNATGSFANELTGRTVDVQDPLQALVAPHELDSTANVNALTDFSAQKTLAQFSSGSTLDQQQQISNQFVLDAFGIGGTTDPGSLQLDQINAQATIDDPNVQLLLLSALLLQDQPEADPLRLFNSLGEQFSTALTLAEIQTALGFFNGSNAQTIYDLIVAQGAITNLPLLVFPQIPAWSCSTASGCGWVPLTPRTISLSSNVTYEADAEVELVVRLSEVAAADVSFTLASTDDTATNMDDYVGIDQQYSILAGEQEKRISIPVVVDNELESQERFRVTIAPITAGYTIFNNVNQVDVLINDGAPALNNSIVNDIAVKRLCVRGIDSPGVNTAADCTVKWPNTVAVTANNNTTLAVELDLQANCTDPLTCDSLSQDRLVEFYLQATDVIGAPQLENKLGVYRYALSDI
ncbi:Calx-beta domain-containing protein [Pseudomonadota bacterium]